MHRMEWHGLLGSKVMVLATKTTKSLVQPQNYWVALFQKTLSHGSLMMSPLKSSGAI